LEGESDAKLNLKTLSGFLLVFPPVSISITDFSKVEMKVGKITSVEDIPQARNPMYKLIVDLGNGVTKQCVAGIKNFYSPDELLGKLVVAVVNLQPKSVAGVMSECMLLAAYNETELSLLKPDKELSVGSKVS
jgi:tRNA-binding protein